MLQLIKLPFAFPQLWLCCVKRSITNLSIRGLHHDVLELHGHREAWVDLDAKGGGAGVGGVGVVGGLSAV